jgi:integrase
VSARPRLGRRRVRGPTQVCARRAPDALNTAIRRRLVTVNAATLIDAPRTVSREIQPLTPDQARALLIASRDQPLEDSVTVALGCGLRPGEALGLQWTDVDLDIGTLQVRRAVQRFGGDATGAELSNRFGCRTKPLTSIDN